MAQGITLGAILQGIHVENDAYAGGWLDWLSPFTLLTGVSLVAGYALLGATWLIWKTEGSSASPCAPARVRTRHRHTCRHRGGERGDTLPHYDYWRRWFSMPGVLLTAQVPLLVVVAAVGLLLELRREPSGCRS